MATPEVSSVIKQEVSRADWIFAAVGLLLVTICCSSRG
jgi:hypothetical protein